MSLFNISFFSYSYIFKVLGIYLWNKPAWAFLFYFVLFLTFWCLKSVFNVCHLGDKSIKWIHLKAQDWCHSITHKCVTFGHYLKVSTLCVLRLTLTCVVLWNRNSVEWICKYLNLQWWWTMATIDRQWLYFRILLSERSFREMCLSYFNTKLAKGWQSCIKPSANTKFCCFLQLTVTFSCYIGESRCEKQAELLNDFIPFHNNT